MTDEKGDINPYDLGEEEAKRYFSNEIKVATTSIEAQERVSRAITFLNGQIERKKYNLEEAGPFAIDIFNSWNEVNMGFKDAGDKSAVDDTLISSMRQLTALSFGIDLSLNQEDHI